MEKKNWLEVTVTVDAETAEAVAEALSRYAENGVVVERGVEYNDAEDVGTPFGPCRVCAYLAVDESLEEKKHRVQEALWYLGRIQPIPEPVFKMIEDENWMDAWKKFYRPIQVSDRVLILPAWIPNEEQDKVVIRIDPSMAFGTGTHPTTQLCLVLAEKYTNIDNDVIDMGCGSGILSIGALLLGARFALGVDIDNESMQSSRENAERNGVSDQLELFKGTVPEILSGACKIRQAPLVMANILTPILIQLFDLGMAELIAPGGAILLSGILEEQDARIRAAAESRGLQFIERIQMGDWVAYAYRK